MKALAHIGVVEDDPAIARMIEATLMVAGHTCAVCGDGLQAPGWIAAGRFDLVLLDVMLPGIDGFEVMRRVQDTGLPVIFLTAMQDVSDKVTGLRLGAEDYIVKPFEAVELLARIDVVLRRFHKTQSRFVYGDIAIDTDRHTVLRAGEDVGLTPKEFDLLAFFIRHTDVALTRERLLAGVWGETFMGESRTVDIHVQQLRKKLGLSEDLVTIPRLGYRLNARKAP